MHYVVYDFLMYIKNIINKYLKHEPVLHYFININIKLNFKLYTTIMKCRR